MESEIVVALSDVHLGAFNSLWSYFDHPDGDEVRRFFRDGPRDFASRRASPGWQLFELFAASLREHVAKSGQDFDQAPRKTLVLNGDILDLSLAPTAFALQNARCFFSQLEGLRFSKVVFVPGNHDHHLWRLVVESQFLRQAVDRGDSRYERTVGEPVPVPILSELLGMKATSLEVAYPHYRYSLDLEQAGPGRQWHLVFHHGHFLESWWTAMSKVLGTESGRPHSIAALEALNEPLTELLWFAIGDAGRLSDVATRLYGSASDPAEMKSAVGKLVDVVVEAVGRHWHRTLPWWLPRVALRALLARFVAHQTSKGSHAELAAAAGSALRGATLEDRLSLAAEKYRSCYADASPSCFVFGHTHKTQKSIDGEFSNLAMGRENWKGLKDHIFNTGGWVVESPREDPDCSYFLLTDLKARLVPLKPPPEAVGAARARSELVS